MHYMMFELFFPGQENTDFRRDVGALEGRYLKFDFNVDGGVVGSDIV